MPNTAWGPSEFPDLGFPSLVQDGFLSVPLFIIKQVFPCHLRTWLMGGY